MPARKQLLLKEWKFFVVFASIVYPLVVKINMNYVCCTLTGETLQFKVFIHFSNIIFFKMNSEHKFEFFKAIFCEFKFRGPIIKT